MSLIHRRGGAWCTHAMYARDRRHHHSKFGFSDVGFRCVQSLPRGLRGGPWIDEPGNVHARNRHGYGPAHRHFFVGVRCVRSLVRDDFGETVWSD